MANVLGKVSSGDIDLMQSKAVQLGDFARVPALVILRAEIEFPRECLELRADNLGCERGNDAGIEPSTEVGAYRDVGAKVHRYGVLNEFPQPLFKVFLGVIEVEVVLDVPVPADANLTLLDDQCVPGEQLPNSLEQRLAGQTELKRQVVFERFAVGLDAWHEREERLD